LAWKSLELEAFHEHPVAIHQPFSHRSMNFSLAFPVELA